MKAKTLNLKTIVLKCSSGDGFNPSFLGCYTNEPADWAILRLGDHRRKYLAEVEDNTGKWGNAFFSYFLPNAKGHAPGSEAYKARGLRDFEHLESQRAGDWGDIRVYAEAEIADADSSAVQIVTSWAVGGIGTTDGRDCIEDIGREELRDLREMLEKLGFDAAAIDGAIAEPHVTQ